MKVVAHPLLVAVALGLLNPASLEEESAAFEVRPEEDEREDALPPADAPAEDGDAEDR